MRKTTLFIAAVAVLAVISVGAWIGVRTPTGALAGSTDQPLVMTTGAKGSPTSHYDDYDIVTH
jgi:hypothetical protein